MISLQCVGMTETYRVMQCIYIHMKNHVNLYVPLDRERERESILTSVDMLCAHLHRQGILYMLTHLYINIIIAPVHNSTPATRDEDLIYKYEYLKISH